MQRWCCVARVARVARVTGWQGKARAKERKGKRMKMKSDFTLVRLNCADSDNLTCKLQQGNSFTLLSLCHSMEPLKPGEVR